MASWYNGIMPACRAGDRGSTPLEVANRLLCSVLRFAYETGCESVFDNRKTACFIIGVSYNGSIRGLGPRGEGSIPSAPTKHRAMEKWLTRRTFNPVSAGFESRSRDQWRFPLVRSRRPVSQTGNGGFKSPKRHQMSV